MRSELSHPQLPPLSALKPQFNEHPSPPVVGHLICWASLQTRWALLSNPGFSSFQHRFTLENLLTGVWSLSHSPTTVLSANLCWTPTSGARAICKVQRDLVPASQKLRGGERTAHQALRLRCVLGEEKPGSSRTGSSGGPAFAPCQLPEQGYPASLSLRFLTWGMRTRLVPRPQG